MSYDTKCEDLAIAFLADIPDYTRADIKGLSQWIQDAIEDWLEQRKERKS